MGIVEWTKKADLVVTDRKTRKLHKRSNVSRLYLPRSEGYLVYQTALTLRSLHCDVSSTREKLLKVAQKYMKAEELEPKECKNQSREEHGIGRKKPTSRPIPEMYRSASSKTWEWLRRELKKETEGLIIAAQDQSLRTNVMKARIEK